MSILVRSPYTYSQNSDTLKPAMDFNLEEVEIISEGPPEVFSQIARTVTIINAEQISSFPAASIQDLLESIAGLDIRQRNRNGVQADIQLRGGTFDQVMVMLNGINLTDPQTGHFNLNLPVNLSMVKRIEVLHGSGARLYGANAYKGVINIVTQEDWSGWNGGIQVGEYGMNHSNFNLGTSFKKHHHSIGISRNFSDGYTENTDYNLRNLFYQGGVQLENTSFSWQAGVNDKRFGANDFYSPRFPEQYEETATKFGSLRISGGTKLKINAQVYFRRHNDHFLLKRKQPSFYENFHQTDVFGYKIQTCFSSAMGYTYIGMEGRNEKIISSILGQPSNNHVPVNGEEDKFYTHDFSRINNGFFIEQRYQNEGLNISGGFLVNHNREYKKKAQIFPGLDISYRFETINLKLFSSAGRSLRLPTFTDMFYVDPANSGNPELQPEELLSFEAGMEYSLSGFTGRLTTFNDLGNNLIDWIIFPDEDVYQAANISEINTAGIETDFRYESINPLSGNYLRKISLGYSWITQDFQEGDYESKYAGDFLRHKLSGSLSLVLAKNFTLLYHISYQDRNGSYPDYDPTGSRSFSSSFKPYWLSDLKLSFSKKYYSLFVAANNIFDTEYTDVGSLTQPGRWISGGIILNGNFPEIKR
jgi:iron complex outermembrane receptor protein